jgi:hypothetical protein
VVTWLNPVAGLYLGANLGKRWRYQTFRDWSGQGLTTSDFTDRKTGRTVGKFDGGDWENVKGYDLKSKKSCWVSKTSTLSQRFWYIHSV